MYCVIIFVYITMSVYLSTSRIISSGIHRQFNYDIHLVLYRVGYGNGTVVKWLEHEEIYAVYHSFLAILCNPVSYL